MSVKAEIRMIAVNLMKKAKFTAFSGKPVVLKKTSQIRCFNGVDAGTDPLKIARNVLEIGQQKQKMISSIVAEKALIIGEDAAWQQYLSLPHKYTEISDGLKKAGYEVPFGVNVGPASGLFRKYYQFLMNEKFALAGLFLALKIDLALFSLGHWARPGQYKWANQVLKCSYYFKDMLNRFGMDNGMITMVKVINGKGRSKVLKLRDEQVPYLPVENWIKTLEGYAKISLGHIPFMTPLEMAVFGGTKFFDCPYCEADEDDARQVLSYQYFIKCMELRENGKEYQAELEIQKAYELAPRNPRYIFLIDIMAADVMKLNYMDWFYTFDRFNNGEMDESEKGKFIDFMEKHPVVRIAYEMELISKSQKKEVYRGRLIEED